MSYKLTVVRIDAHPKAGEEMPRRWNGYHNEPERYPDTMETAVLSVELSDDEYAAVKRACVEASK